MLTVLRRVFSFSDWYQSHPKEPPPGDMLDASFDAQDSKINELLGSLEGLRRADGALQNGIVTRDTLDPQVYGDLRFEMHLAAAAERKKAEEEAQKAEISSKSAENALLGAQMAEISARADANAVSNAKSGILAHITSLIGRSEALLADLRSAEAQLAETESYAGESEAWAYSSALWAEHMPDTLPDNALKTMDVTGDQHWSSKWWASKAAAAFGQLSELYLGAHPVPPSSTSTGEPIPIGGIYYNTETGMMYVWDGSQWVSMTQPQRAGLAALWYNATEGQTVFPFSVMDLNGRNYALSLDATEGVDAHVNGIKLMPKEGPTEGDWTLNASTSTVTFLRPLRLGDIVSFDILMANEKLGPGAVNTWSLSLTEAQDGTRTSFTLDMEDGAGPSVTVNKNEELLVSLDGVIQEPGVGYSSTGSTITFATAPAADSLVFITWFRSEGGGTGGGGSTAWADITGKPSTFPPTVPIAWTDVSGKPATFAPDVHTHAYSSLTSIPSTFAPSSHNHPTSEVTGLDTALTAKAPLASPALTGTPTAPLPAVATDSTQIATTEWVKDQYLTNSVVFDPPSQATNVVGAIQTLTVTGAAVGDYCSASFSIDLNGMILIAWVSGANTTKFQFQNKTAGTLDLASGTVRVRVWKQ